MLGMVIRLLSILGNIHIQPNDFMELFTLCHSFISAFSLYCISFGSVDMIVFYSFLLLCSTNPLHRSLLIVKKRL